MELSGAATIALVIGYIGFGLVTAAAFAGIAFALTRLNSKLSELIDKADPILAKIDEALTVTNNKIAAIGDKAEGILAQGEETAETVHHKVDKTATAVQRTVHAPIIGLNSLAAGLSRGVETFGKLQRRSGTAEAGSSTDTLSPAKAYTSNGSTITEQAPAFAGKETVDGR